MRKGSQRLATLLKLAALREQNAARALGTSGERLRQAQQQSEQLESYRSEYEQTFIADGARPRSAREFANFQGFFGQLSQVQQQQVQQVTQREADCEAARQRWLALHARHNLLDQLRDRKVKKEQFEAEKRLQRELDDRIRLNCKEDLR